MSQESVDPIAALEAILFVTEAPVPPSELAEVLEVPADDVDTLVEGLAKRLVDRRGRASETDLGLMRAAGFTYIGVGRG